jgi:hypothetical protein
LGQDRRLSGHDVIHPLIEPHDLGSARTQASAAPNVRFGAALHLSASPPTPAQIGGYTWARMGIP